MPDLLPDPPVLYNPPDNLAELQQLGIVLNLETRAALNVAS